MSTKRRTATKKPADDPNTDAPSATIKRRSNGQWEKGYCPNRKGRPRKPKPDNILASLMDEKLPSSGLTVREGMLRSLVVFGMKDPRIALRLLELGLLMLPDTAPSEADLAPEEDAQLDGFLAREARRRTANGWAGSEGA